MRLQAGDLRPKRRHFRRVTHEGNASIVCTILQPWEINLARLLEGALGARPASRQARLSVTPQGTQRANYKVLGERCCLYLACEESEQPVS